MRNSIHNLIREKKTLFLPDIGTFFNDDIDLALVMVDQLSQANIPVLKAEILHNADICLESNLKERYYSSSKKTIIEEDYRKIIERKVVSLDDYEKIFNRVKSKGCDLVVSVYDNKGVDFAVSQEVVAIKIASSNMNFGFCPVDLSLKSALLRNSMALISSSVVNISDFSNIW